MEISIEARDYGVGGIAGMCGDAEILKHETAPYVYWEETAKRIDSGDYYNNIKKICGSETTYDLLLSLAILENSNAENGTLLIYGDSQIETAREIPNYLSEHYKRVVNVGINPVIKPELDDYINPGTVLFSCSERYINIRLTADLPALDLASTY
jgi:hypothetical protein